MLKTHAEAMPDARVTSFFISSPNKHVIIKIPPLADRIAKFKNFTYKFAFLMLFFCRLPLTDGQQNPGMYLANVWTQRFQAGTAAQNEEATRLTG
ncbi:hypothetical protein BN2475_450118 [Paraburkholderia ribeironis]|uniref:Uncharacterized protein n=1 Tax=Paraburkholderia ribeironis TaxID=1247936 RepID=A0A1N7S904_9BURK|nr:hypothetical protein BN2475_450118 [Paraburkholderia ribeironis]